jgi:hypothetical protein
MKRRFAALALTCFAFAQSQPPPPTPSKDSRIKQQTAGDENSDADNHKRVPPISVVVNTPITQGETQQQHSSSSTEHVIEILTLFIFLATAAQAIIYAFQTGVMKKSLAATQKATDAAKASADAANRNIDFMIAKERARLKIGIQEVSTEMPLSKQLIWIVTNHGNSKAFITYAQSRAFCVRGDEAPPNISASSMQNPALYRNPIKPDEQWNEFAVVLPHFGVGVQTDIRDERVFLYFYACVKYRDAFGSYQTKVLRRLHPIPVWASQRPGYAEWQPEGEPTDNQET